MEILKNLPTELYSDEPQLETDLHLRQIILLLTSLEWYWGDRQDFFASGNITIYYSPHQKKSEDFRGPDFFVVKDTERRTRKSWIVWEENGKYPNVIVEILSSSTAKTDRGEKKQIYQDIFRTPNYFWFEPNTLEFAGFRLNGSKYQAIKPNKEGWLYSDELELYLGIYKEKLRYFTPKGDLVPTSDESAIQERIQKQLIIQEKQLIKEENDKLKQKLIDLGIDPNLL